jgi:hypothetical protein
MANCERYTCTYKSYVNTSQSHGELKDTRAHTNILRKGSRKSSRSHGPVESSSEGGLKADFSGNETVTAHERSLQLTANTKPEQARELLRGQPVRARGGARSSHGALLEISGGRVKALDVPLPRAPREVKKHVV